MLSTFIIALAVLSTFTQAVMPIVDIGYSKYQGTALPNGITQWLGISYAAPPLGELRFRAAQPPEYNHKLQIADKHGPICIPTPTTGNLTGYSEDCLYLDVYAPSTASTWKPLPVYVFIQGGGFNTNGNPNYNGSGLITGSDNNIIIVTFGYRVGPYGFLTSKEVLEDGDVNNGLKDQRLVLKWVQKNIYQFGGDPGRVTIGGDSAGGASVDLQLSAYGGRNDGLFHAAAAESQSFGIQYNVAESQYQYDALVARTGCNTTVDTLKCLRSLSTEDLQAQNINIPSPGGAGAAPVFMYSSVVDYDFAPDYTYNLYREGKFIHVPTIWGDVTNGGTIFVPNTTASLSAMNAFLKDQFPVITDAQLAQIDTFYPKTVEQFNGTGAYWRATANAYGDMRYMCPGLYVSSAYSNAWQRTWNYHYDVHDPAEVAAGFGVVHAIEVYAIWGPDYVTGTPPASYSTSLNKGIVRIMQGYWTSFIRAHDPNIYRAEGTPVWEQWNAWEMNRIRFETNDTTMEIVDPVLEEHCKYFWGIATDLQQ